jgi:hypothetical protein
MLLRRCQRSAMRRRPRGPAPVTRVAVMRPPLLQRLTVYGDRRARAVSCRMEGDGPLETLKSARNDQAAPGATFPALA